MTFCYLRIYELIVLMPECAVMALYLTWIENCFIPNIIIKQTQKYDL